MLAGLGGGDRLLGVEAHRRRDVYRRDFGIANQIAPVAMSPPGADLPGKGVGEIRLRTADGDEIAIGATPQRVSHAPSNDVAGADQTPGKTLHTVDT